MKKSNLKVFIRCDGDYGKKNGMGHIYRSIEIVKLLKKKYEIIFLTKSPKIVELFLKKKTKCKIINIKKFNQNKLEKLFNISSVLINDTFGKDKKINIIAEKNNSKIICFDDNKINFKKGLLINAITHYKQKNRFSRNIKYYGGFKYLILRNFKKYKKLKYLNKSFFVSSGGSDIHSFLYKVSRILINMEPKKIKVMVGYGVKKNNRIFNLAKKNKKIKLLKNINNPIKHMQSCEYVIVTGGTVCFESVAAKLNTICIQNYDHQIPAVKFLSKKKVLQNFGTLKGITKKKFTNLFRKNKFNNEINYNNNIIDFNGIKRLKTIINNFLKEKNPNHYSS